MRDHGSPFFAKPEITLNPEKAVRVTKPTGIDPKTSYTATMLAVEGNQLYPSFFLVAYVDPEGLTQARLDMAQTEEFASVQAVLTAGWRLPNIS